MKAGIVVPQGWTGEYAGWDPVRAWERSIVVARRAEELGFAALWAWDHFHTGPVPTDDITFESFVLLAALSRETTRASLGQLVSCAGFRNPALAAKMISCLDVSSQGRAVFGIGAGWKRDEWEAYGYAFSSAKERLERLAEQLEIVKRMLSPGRATFEGSWHRVKDAINEPKGADATRVPIMVGGNGPDVTWRLAARFADELNLDGMSPGEVAAAMPVIAERCREVDRDPTSLAVSVHFRRRISAEPGPARVEAIRGFRDAGVSRVDCFVKGFAASDEALDRFCEDCDAAGVELG